MKLFQCALFFMRCRCHSPAGANTGLSLRSKTVSAVASVLPHHPHQLMGVPSTIVEGAHFAYKHKYIYIYKKVIYINRNKLNIPAPSCSL